ncbi:MULTISPECIES: hypothetical protein [Thermomonosporaceae]|uniref:hypothetical protein n=1 Tax=Thermomonosporaceae TaxID=2012 RepID=UPI00255B32C9|nr:MULTISPECIES: hypothetical protein [Thermomonosporaceae]MDL4776275.1 hypothetical protein [Actinomadura xylanilytica]
MARKTKAALAAVACAALLAAPGARADGSVRVEPGTVQPGESVQLSVPDTCTDPTARSKAFPIGSRVDLRYALDATTPRPFGAAPIDPGAEPGVYPVEVACAGGGILAGRITVTELVQGSDAGGGGLASGLAAARSGRDWGVLVTVGAGVVLSLAAGLGLLVGRKRRSGSDG